MGFYEISPHSYHFRLQSFTSSDPIYHLLLVLLLGLFCTFPVTARPFGAGEAYLHLAFQIKSCHGFINQEWKKPHWRFFPLLPLPVILRILFPSLPYKNYYIHWKNYSTTCSGSNSYLSCLRVIFVYTKLEWWFFPVCSFPCITTEFKSQFIFCGQLQCLAGGYLFYYPK